MRRDVTWVFVLVSAALLTMSWACGQPTPSPGAKPAPAPGPGATAALDRTVLPIAEPTYPAITELDARNAKAPPIFEVKAPAGAPNVLVILLDNFGYAGSTTFGGVMNLPTIERLAKNGLIYTNFHTAPICSASRVALLTGRNPHSANMGTISEMATGFPGQTSVLPNSVAPLAKILRFNGYSTAMFGKSHEYVPWESGLTGPFDQWPTGLGFERFYGNVIGESDQFSPVAHDNTTLAPPSKDPNYYYQTDLADRAIQWIKAQKSLNPDKPFFVYYPAQGMHDPVQLPKAWRDKYKGKFDQGWDKYREEILARQKKLGIVPENTKLTPKADIAPDWDTLTADEKKVAIRYQELFAAFAELTDYEIGRVVQAIEDVGVLDNTLIIYVTGDNGASPNGGRLGVFNTMSTFNQSPETLEYQLKTLDEVGGPHSAMTPPAGWSFGDNTPFAYSQLHTQLGGTTNGAIVSWPKGIKAKGETPQAVSPRDRRRPDRAGGRGAAAAEDGQWRRPETHRRREHDELLRRRAGEVGSHDAVLRDLRQPRHLQGWLVRLDPAQGVVGAEAAHDFVRRRQVGAVQHWRKTTAVPPTCRRSIPTSSRSCRRPSWRRRSSTTCCRSTIAPRSDSTPRSPGVPSTWEAGRRWRSTRA